MCDCKKKCKKCSCEEDSWRAQQENMRYIAELERKQAKRWMEKKLNDKVN